MWFSTTEPGFESPYRYQLPLMLKHDNAVRG